MKENLRSKKELMKDLLQKYEQQDEYKKQGKSKVECKILDCYTRKLELELKGELQFKGGGDYGEEKIYVY